MTPYRTIVADPPWITAAGPRHFQVRKPTRANPSPDDARYTSSTRSLQYPTMTVAEIAKIPVCDMVEHDAHLYIWTINRYVEDAYTIARAWGFKPSTLLTWCKEPRGIGLGGTFSLANEHVLFCRRGSLPSRQRVDRNWWLWRRTAHSVKPEAFLDIVEQVSPGPYLEMFARPARFGWDYWGDQSLGTAEMEEVHTAS